MRSLFRRLQLVSTAGFLLISSGAVVFADDAVPAAPAPIVAPSGAKPAELLPDPAAWQDVITGQIEAFRKADAKAAFGYAAAPFQKAFSDPAVFMMSIAQSGYLPILTSVSHSFGTYTQPDTSSVVQIVNLVGPKQELFEAIYFLGKEDGGWRVQGVQLSKQPGMGV
jgi:hypothetical protein